MNIISLLKLEYLKNTNKSFYILLLIAFYIFQSSFLNSGIFEITTYKISEIVNISFFKLIYGINILFFFLSLIFITSVYRDIKHNILIKHISDGLSLKKYIQGKLVLLLYLVILFLIYFFIGVIINGLSVSFYDMLNFFSFKLILFIFLGFIFWGILGVLYLLIFNKPVFAILFLLLHVLVEFIIAVIEKANTGASIYGKYLPIFNINNVLFNSQNAIVYILIICYSLILVYLIRRQLKKRQLIF